MFVVIGLVLALVLVLIFSNRRTRNCRWREDRAGDRDGQKHYKCMSCGPDAFTSTGKPPLDCKANTPDL